MPETHSPSPPSILSQVRQSWRALVVADLAYKLLALIVLTPLFGLLYRGLLSLAGSAVLSDVDILWFFAGPVGWVCGVLLGSVWLGIFALEVSSLLAILAARELGRPISTFDSLRFAAAHAVPVLRIAGRLIALGLLILAPFLLVAAGTYWWLLSRYDINYYLRERPPEFQLAVGLGAVLGSALAAVLLRALSSRFLILPLTLFDRLSPRGVFGHCRNLMAGRRLAACRWLTAWLAGSFLLGVVATSAVGLAGRLLIPTAVGSLTLLTARIGLMLLVMFVVNLALSTAGMIAFAAILYAAWRRWNPRSEEALREARLRDGGTALTALLLTRRQLAAWSIVLAVVAVTIGVAAINTLSLEDRVAIMAHRGASHAAPENTIAAIQGAIDAGADWVEIDVQETADGEVVVLHDSDFMKLSRNPLKIWDARLADLRDIDIGSWFDPKFADQRVPTLAEVLRLCRDRIGVNIELKYYGRDQNLEQRVVEIVEREGMAGQVLVMSLKAEGIRKVKALRPRWRCGLLLSVSLGDLRKIEADFLAVNARFASPDFVRRSHTAGKDVYVWTVNDAATMSQLMNRGVDGILTDRPELARAVLAQRAELNSAERLLMEIAGLLGAPPQVAEQ